MCLQQFSISSTPQRLQRLWPPWKAVHDLHPSRCRLVELLLWNLAAAEVRWGQGKLSSDVRKEQTKIKCKFRRFNPQKCLITIIWKRLSIFIGAVSDCSKQNLIQQLLALTNCHEFWRNAHLPPPLQPLSSPVIQPLGGGAGRAEPN